MKSAIIKILVGEPSDLIEPPRQYELLLGRRNDLVDAFRFAVLHSSLCKGRYFAKY